MQSKVLSRANKINLAIRVMATYQPSFAWMSDLIN